MANPCIKTGAEVWSQQHGGHLHGDLYRIHSCYILRYTGTVQYFLKEEKDCHCTFLGQDRDMSDSIHHDKFPDSLVMAGPKVWIEDVDWVVVHDKELLELIKEHS